MPTDVDDYREQLVISLSSARQTAAQMIRRAQKRYKRQFDRKASCQQFKTGDWVFVKFPHEETGKRRKLSRPWHGPYRVSSVCEPTICVTSVYFPTTEAIKIHLSRVKACPPNLPAGFYWYGGNKKSLGHTPKWVDGLLSQDVSNNSDVDDSDSHDTQDLGNADTDERVSDSAAERDVSDSEKDHEPEPEVERKDNPRYSLRRRPVPPDRYMDSLGLSSK